MSSTVELVNARETVDSVIREVAAELGRVLPPLSDELPLLDTGLDSLCLAVIVARLEDRLGVDPFSGDGEIELPTTIGDLVRLYETALR